MIHIHLSDPEREVLQKLKKEHSNAKIRLKSEVILLKDLGYSHQEVIKIANVCRFTIKNYLKLYQEGGIAKLTEDKHYIPTSKLAPYEEKIKEHFEKNPAFSINHAIEEIEKISGHRMSPTRTGVFMKQIGLKFLKTGSIPAKQMEEKKQVEQEEFKKKS